MLSEALSGLAAAGGTALMGAAATDAWHSVRARFARLLGQGAPPLEQVELERLDRGAADVESAPEHDRDTVRRHLERRWTDRLEVLLEEHPETAAELRALIDEVSAGLPHTTQTWVQNNVAQAGAVQNITQHGDINVGGATR